MPSKPKGAVRQARKRYAAHIFRYRCAYCRRGFKSLDHATLDHIVPQCLWRTWSATALALACLDCNQKKADRFPLSLALVLLAWATRGEQSTVHVDTPTVHGESTAFTDRAAVFTSPFTLDVWRLLARLAHANQSTPNAPESADRHGQRSTPDLPESTPHHPTERTAA